eukprot:gene5865-8089_t
MSVKKVAIIGAGASGLITAKVMRDRGFNVVIFEKNNEIGGVWNYKSQSGVMYDSLRTNLPKEIMSFNYEYQFDENKSHSHSFVTHNDVQNYLLQFTEQENLESIIEFNSVVENIEYRYGQWEVSILQKTKQIEFVIQQSNMDIQQSKNYMKVNYFDAVLICNGHFNKPYQPKVEGLESFTGLSVHSSQYDCLKSNQIFNNKTILVVGSKSSGTDMARELSELNIAKKVYVSDRNSLECQTYVARNSDNSNTYSIEIFPQIRNITQNLIRFKSINHEEIVNNNSNGISNNDYTVNDVDIILWCTGFQYSFPFLRPNQNYDDLTLPEVEDGKRVRNLYHQLFSIANPTLAFLGLPYSVVPFPMFYYQAEWIASVYTNKSQLPSKIDQIKWLKNYEESLMKMNLFNDKYHFMGGNLQWDYFRFLVLSSQLENVELSLKYVDAIQSIFEDNSINKPKYVGAPDTYRSRNYIFDRSSFNWEVQEAMLEKEN